MHVISGSAAQYLLCSPTDANLFRMNIIVLHLGVDRVDRDKPIQQEVNAGGFVAIGLLDTEREPHIWARFIPFSSRANAHFWQILLKQNRPKPDLKPFERKATRSRYSERKQERIAAISCGITSRPLTTCGLQKSTPSSLWYSGFTQDRCLSIGLLIGRQRRGWGLPLRRLLTSA